MDIAPIRSPAEMQRAQMRLVALAAVKRGAAEELEYVALRDAVEHYRCVTERVFKPAKAAWDGPDAIALDAPRQPDRAS